jgi:diacylglycerol kinase family enzyme
VADIAVVAHSRKSFGGGLPELRQILAREGVLPAGTANLLAANLGIPHDLAQAVDVGLHGDRRRIDTGSVNGERFTVMAGAGFDARMISDADRGAKDRLGQAAYVVTGLRNLGARRVRATVKVDGKPFFKGKLACVLAANVGKVLGGVEAFPQAQPDNGHLELGVVTARNPVRPAGNCASRPTRARSRCASRLGSRGH